MSVADLLAFCQQMTRHNTPINDTSVDDIKSQICKYQKDIQKAMDIKTVTTFDGSNYQTWCIEILVDAEVISDSNILMKNQHIGVEYAVSLAEECLNVMKELTTLHINNDYLMFQRRFCYLVACHKKLTNDSENFYHDLFLISLKEHQKFFVKTCLNDFYAISQNSIKNIDIDNLMKQLMNLFSSVRSATQISMLRTLAGDYTLNLPLKSGERQIRIRLSNSQKMISDSNLNEKQPQSQELSTTRMLAE
ncbi:hypothetical protein PABG_12279 [Paracoccidioides brasiliensis Pb03]|nr:hypothetical protein PABG_12279 [Paracoccidioides brasiliensis Pb03]